MEKNDDSPEDVKRATSVEREIKRGEKDDTFEGYPRQEKKKRWEHCDKTPSKRSKRQKSKLNGDCCETRKSLKKKAKKFTKVSVFGEPCTFPKLNIIPRHCLTKQDHINILATESRKCPADCQKRIVLRRLRPVSQRTKELAQPPRRRMLISLQEGAAVLPPALLDNLVRTLENETCLTPEQAAIVSRKKKFAKKKRGKQDTSRQKEASRLNKPNMGSAIAGSFDKDSVFCQYSIAERFVKSILKWKCPIPKAEFNDISKVIVERLVHVLDCTCPQNEDRKSQQLRFLADTIACWISGVLSDVAKHQEKNLEEICKKKETEWAAAEGEEEELEEDQEEEQEEEEDEEVKDNGGKETEQTSIVDADDERKNDIGGVTESVSQLDNQDVKIVHVKDNEEIDVITEQATMEEEVETKYVKTAVPLETVARMEMESEQDTESIAGTNGTRKSVTEADTNTEAKIEIAKEVEVKSKVDSEVGMETEPDTETETETETVTEIEAETGAEATEETEAKGRIEEPEEGNDNEIVSADEEKTDYSMPSELEELQVETKVPSTLLSGEKVTPEEEGWKDALVKGDLEELFKSDIPFLTFGKIIDTVYKMIESTPENTAEDPVTNGIHRAIYEKLTNIVMLEDPNLLTEELKDVVDVVCGKIANWLKTILSKSEMAFMEQCMPVVESKEIRDWTKWLEHISDVAIDWNIWLRGVIEHIFRMSYAKVTRGEWKDWTKSVDTGALLWRKFHLQTIHQAHRNVTMLTGRNIVKTGTKTPCTVSEQLIFSTELHA
nr:uncharacterized protein LOC116430354 [Nomia melanderi]